METHLRSVLKGISWRLGGTLTTILVAWLLTDNITVATKIGIVETVLKIGAFYLHERIWNYVNIGRKKYPEYEI